MTETETIKNNFSVTDPDPGSGAFLTPGSGSGSGMEKNPEPGSGIRDEHPGSCKYQFFRLKVLKFFDADPDPGILSTLDPGSGMEKIGSGIRDNDPGSATL
jgi:hypothetical protein